MRNLTWKNKNSMPLRGARTYSELRFVVKRRAAKLNTRRVSAGLTNTSARLPLQSAVKNQTRTPVDYQYCSAQPLEGRDEDIKIPRSSFFFSQANQLASSLLV